MKNKEFAAAGSTGRGYRSKMQPIDDYCDFRDKTIDIIETMQNDFIKSMKISFEQLVNDIIDQKLKEE